MTHPPDPARADELFWKALALPADARSAFLRRECPSDPDLRASVLSLLAMHEEAEPGTAGTSSAEETVWAARPAIPEQVGPYRILDRIDVGGMGVVYRAQQEHPRREVAVKVLRMGLGSDSARKMFEAEIEAQGRLQHPGIAQIYEAGVATVDGVPQPYFAMELIRGRPLMRYADEEGLDPRGRLRLFARICEAVQHAHHRGIVHRDLKPGNVLVEDGDRPKVLDFGIAQALDPDHQLKTTTDSSQILGTLWYMSPEQARGDVRELDVRSDVYSLGVVLFQLLSHRLPYPPRPLAHQILRAIEEEAPLRLDELEPSTRGDVATIVHKCLEKEPARRYDSASELAADISRHLRHEPVLARPAPAWELWLKFARRHRALVGGVAATMIALATGLTLTLYQLHLRNIAEARRSTAERERATADEDRVTAELRAELQGDKFHALRDFERIEAVLERAAQLHPPHPGMVEPMQRWLHHARELVRELPERTRFLAELRAERGQLVGDRWLFDEPTEQWLHDRYVDLEQEFHDLQVSLLDVELRLRLATTVEERFYTPYEREWDVASSEIMLHPDYRGLEMEWQAGLLPLGANPHSTLWEFWVPETGARPVRDEETLDWILAPETAVVLVLVPPGRAELGSQSRTEEKPLFDPLRATWERRRSVHLRAYFISKYELTQGQWRRITGANPSRHSLVPLIEVGGSRDHHPVESISWEQARLGLLRVGLSIPTEAQWEWAARGGTTTPWWCGSTEAEFFKAEAGNVADATAESASAPPWSGPFSRWFDGRAVHGPAGLYSPNPWGLYGTCGNVAEWCRDWADVSTREVRDRNGDGLRIVIPPEERRLRVVKGGAFDQPYSQSRPAHRDALAPDSYAETVGVRPVRRVSLGLSDFRVADSDD